jgi:hypothetical protein
MMAAIKENINVCLIVIPPFCEIHGFDTAGQPNMSSKWPMKPSVSSKRRSHLPIAIAAITGKLIMLAVSKG